jgi:hypothetical protein
MMIRRGTELLIAVALFCAASWWGASYWTRSLQAGRAPIFYQEYFEPAVMMTCGKGFVIAQPQGKAMEDFLFRRVDTFSCASIPADAQLGTRGLYQGVWRYLLVATSIGWRFLGISWSGMGPLFGLFFGATIVGAYGILRLGMGRALALIGALGFATSPLHLLNLPHLRDYSKAPFTLALLLVTGILVKSKLTPRTALGCAAIYGLILGIGYGFRTDFLINIPFFFIVLLLFTDGCLLRNIPLKAAAAALCLITFVATAWPIISVVYRSGGCQWHTALLGLGQNFTEGLELSAAPYDWGSAYADGFVYKTAVSYGRRIQPGSGHIEYCSHAYDEVTGRYLMEIAGRFPADMLTRAYASALHITSLAFAPAGTPLPDVAPTFYGIREHGFSWLRWTGPFWAGAALFLLGTTSVRLALFLAFVLLYVGGYPAIQFSNRHYFHLELLTWWSAGFVLQQLASKPSSWIRLSAQAAPGAPSWRQGARVTALICSVAVTSLLILRGYQQLTLKSFFQRYLVASTETVAAIKPDMPPGTLYRISPSPAADAETGEEFLAVTLNASRCGVRPAVTFRYDEAYPDANFTRTFTIGTNETATTLELAHIFTPVYKRFVGVELSGTPPGCDGTVARVSTSDLTLLLPVALPPRWDREPLYQRFKALPMLSQ